MNNGESHEVYPLRISEFIFSTHALKIVKYNYKSIKKAQVSAPPANHTTLALKKEGSTGLPIQLLTKG